MTSIESAAATGMRLFRPARKGLYAILQSSRMGGYGKPIVEGLTRAGCGVLGGSQGLGSYLHGRHTSKADDTAKVEREQEQGVKEEEPAESKAIV